MKLLLLLVALLGLLLPDLCAQPAGVAQGGKPSYSEKYALRTLSLPPGGHFQGIQRWQFEGKDRLFLSASCIRPPNPILIPSLGWPTFGKKIRHGSITSNVSGSA